MMDILTKKKNKMCTADLLEEIALKYYNNFTLQGRRKVWKSGGASSN